MENSFHLEEKLFADALLLPRSERKAFVERSCANNDRLVAAVTALLEAHERETLMLAERARELATAAAAYERSADPYKPGSRIGRYELVEEIGTGGCGVVYRARQIEPVQREVALKILKPGMDTREVITRFERERQALALMTHPRIARVFDGGVTESLRPYFVMELVAGQRITDFCDRHQLTVVNRLKLFGLVCEGVQHAHLKGVIHRDLKPSNILVGVEGDEPQPKIIDFGIAKAIQGPLTEYTHVTHVEHVVGTPAYMSPEQAGLGEVDVDTRSDIYSLGVLLYELLTGLTPFQTLPGRSLSLEEARRQIREEYPLRPSARVRGLELAVRTSVAGNRRTEVGRLAAFLRGDLDGIVMRCLEKDRGRRYETVSALARDLEAHLRHEPVSVRSRHGSYVIKKWIRRHRLAFVLGCLSVASLVGGTVISLSLYFRETHALRRALEAENEQTRLRVRAESGEQLARIEAVRSKQMVAFLNEVIGSVNLAVSKGRDTRLLRDNLDATLGRVRAELGNEPEVASDLLDNLGRAYAALLDYQRAEEVHREELALRERVYGPLHPKTVWSLESVGISLQYQDRKAEAGVIFRDAYARMMRQPERDGLRFAWSTWRIARVLQQEGKYAEAEETFRESLRLMRAVQPPDSSPVRSVLRAMAMLYHATNRLAEAEAAYRELLTLAPVQPGDHDDNSRVSILAEFASTLMLRQKYGEAEAALLESLAGMKALYAGDEDHPRARSRITQSMSLLGSVYLRQERFDESEKTFLEVLGRLREEMAERTNQPKVQGTYCETLNHLASVYQQQGRYREVEATAREAVERFRRVPQRLKNSFAEALVQLGQALEAQERWAEAEVLFPEALAAEMSERPDRLGFPIVDGWLQALRHQGKTEALNEGVAMILKIAREAPGTAGLMTASSFVPDLIQALVIHQPGEPVVSVARELLQFWEKAEPEAWQCDALRSLIGASLLSEGNYAEAEPYLRAGTAGLELRKDRLPARRSQIRRFAFSALARFYRETGRPEEAAACEGILTGARRPTQP